MLWINLKIHSHSFLFFFLFFLQHSHSFHHGHREFSGNKQGWFNIRGYHLLEYHGKVRSCHKWNQNREKASSVSENSWMLQWIKGFSWNHNARSYFLSILIFSLLQTQVPYNSSECFVCGIHLLRIPYFLSAQLRILRTDSQKCWVLTDAAEINGTYVLNVWSAIKMLSILENLTLSTSYWGSQIGGYFHQSWP